ncbi:MAG: ABC transporter permease [Chthoniobacterales bacterium]
MKLFSKAVNLLRNLARRRAVERDLAAEVDSYLDLSTHRKLRDGLSEPAARRAALIELGGAEQVKEQVREVRLGHWLETLLKDVRFGLRSLGKSPGFTAVALLTLALGIGANTAIFSIIHTVILRPLPYPQPARLVKIWPDRPLVSTSKADFLEIKTRARSFEDIAAYSNWGFTLTGTGEPAKLEGARTTANLFSVLGADAASGRVFASDEDQPGKSDVVLLSHGLWQSRFGSDRAIVGRTITIDGKNLTVVGVMPKWFNFPEGMTRDLWIPATLDRSLAEDFASGYLTLLGRLKPGVTTEQARSEIMAVARSVREQRPNIPAEYGSRAEVNSLQSESVARIRPTLFILLGTVGLVLLIACANVANLQLARTSNRQRELAVRAALGASRARLVRQLLTESLLLSILGGAAGIVLAYVGLDFLLTLIPADTPRTAEISISANVLAFSLGISALAGVLFGLAPALQTSSPDLQSPLKEGGRSSSSGGGRLRSLLVISEVALALTLVIGAGLLIKSFWRLQRVNPGFEADQVISFQLSPADFDNAPDRARTYYRQILERLAHLPGVQSVGGVHLLPMGDSNWDPALRIEDRPLPPGASAESVNWRLVTADYFRTMSIPLLKGRAFTEADNENSERVALINETLARKYWPGEDPLGKRINTGFEGKGVWVTIVGIVGDVRQQSLREPTVPEMYRPFFQHKELPPLTIMIRTATSAAGVAPSIRSAVWSIDKNVPITDLQSMTAVVAQSISQSRSTMLMLTAFAAIGLVLGLIGVYGVISYSVAQRTHEIGVRMALGAKSSDVLKLVLGQGLRLTVIGAALGLLGAFGLTRLMASLLFGVSASDPITFAVVTVSLTLVASLASYLPARRAAKLSPMLALRYE